MHHKSALEILFKLSLASSFLINRTSPPHKSKHRVPPVTSVSPASINPPPLHQFYRLIFSLSSAHPITAFRFCSSSAILIPSFRSLPSSTQFLTHCNSATNERHVETSAARSIGSFSSFLSLLSFTTFLSFIRRGASSHKPARTKALHPFPSSKRRVELVSH